MKLLIMPFPPHLVSSSLSGTYILFITLQSHTLNIIPLLWDTKLYSHIKQHAKLNKQRVTSSNISSYSSQALQSPRTLACRTVILRSFRSLATARQLLIPNVCKFSLTSSVHLFRGLPLFLFRSSMAVTIFRVPFRYSSLQQDRTILPI